MKRKFWNWVRNEGERTLFLNGEISDETWYGDEVTPKLFKDELLSGEGDITVWINSPGGDVFAAAQIYNMLMDYKGNAVKTIQKKNNKCGIGNRGKTKIVVKEHFSEKGKTMEELLTDVMLEKAKQTIA